MSIAQRVINKLSAIASQRTPFELRDPATIAKVSAESLLFYYGNIHSQRGQDGILSEIFRRVGISRGRFVEFGAWDGVYLSNCRYLYEKGWSGVFIEGDTARFRALYARYQDATVRCVNAMVGTERGQRVVEIAGDDADFVSIDIDGNDLEVFANLGFRPPVVLMEGGFNFSPLLITPLPVHLAADNWGQPLAVICERARALGYVPVCFFQDTYFVREDLARAFTQRDAAQLFADGYYFMSIDYRQSLLNLRAASPVIRNAEVEYFGAFHVDPLAYAIPVHEPPVLK